MMETLSLRIARRPDRRRRRSSSSFRFQQTPKSTSSLRMTVLLRSLGRSICFPQMLSDNHPDLLANIQLPRLKMEVL